MLSTRTCGLACAVAVFVCLMAAPAAAQPPLVAMVGTLALLSAATLWDWPTRLR